MGQPVSGVDATTRRTNTHIPRYCIPRTRFQTTKQTKQGPHPISPSHQIPHPTPKTCTPFRTSTSCNEVTFHVTDSEVKTTHVSQLLSASLKVVANKEAPTSAFFPLILDGLQGGGRGNLAWGGEGGSGTAVCSLPLSCDHGFSQNEISFLFPANS